MGFVADCLRLGVEQSCYENGRRGFGSLKSKDTEGPIEFEITYRENQNSRPITYNLAISSDKYEHPYIEYERLRQRRAGEKYGNSYSFLNIINDKGEAWAGEMLEG